MSYDPEVHAGGEGTVVVNAVDWNVKSWSGKLNKTNVNITTTGDYDSATNMTYGRKKTTVATFDFQLDAWRDGNNDFLPGIASGSGIGDDLTNVVLTSWTGKTVTMPKAIANTIDIKSNGVEGVTELTIDGSSQGKFTLL